MAYDPRFDFATKEAEGMYAPELEELEFIQKVYTDFQNDLRLRLQPMHILENRDLRTYWDESKEDYNTYVPPARADDWMRMYRRPLTRDKVNSFIAHLGQSLLIPNVRAQNKDQEIDRQVSRAARAMLEHAEKNDGKPSKNGLRKFIDIVHKCVVEGTVFAQEDWDPEEKKAVKTIVPNEEIYISNFWQPDIQKQRHIFRFQDKVLYEEAMEEFGNLPNWKYVQPGETINWHLGQLSFFKELNVGTLLQDQVHIARIWYPVPKNKLGKGKKREKYYNVIVNGILMFPVDNKMPYRHGWYPFAKEVFEMFDTEFFYGNSLPNKARKDQAIYDSFYTLILNKMKLNLRPPLASLNGLHIDQDIIRPGVITQVDEDPTKSLVKIPGVAESLNNADIGVLNLIERSIDTSTAAPIVSGQQGAGGQKTATEIATQQANARQLLGIFGLMIENLIQQLAYLRVPVLFQFVPRLTINKLVVADQPLQNGRRGSLEILFEKPRSMTEGEVLAQSAEILKEEETSLARGESKEKMFIDPEYLNELDLFIEINVETALRESSALERAMGRDKYALYRGNEFLNQEEVTRALVRSEGDDEDVLIRKEALQPMQTGAQPAQKRGLTETLTQSPERLMSPLTSAV